MRKVDRVHIYVEIIFTKIMEIFKRRKWAELRIMKVNWLKIKVYNVKKITMAFNVSLIV